LPAFFCGLVGRQGSIGPIGHVSFGFSHWLKAPRVRQGYLNALLLSFCLLILGKLYPGFRYFDQHCPAVGIVDGAGQVQTLSRAVQILLGGAHMSAFSLLTRRGN